MQPFFWASGVVSPAEADLLALRTEIRSLLSLHFTEEAPWILITAVHGWDFDPLWVRDWRAILAAWRFVSHRRSGLRPHPSLTHASRGHCSSPRPVRSWQG